MLAYCLTYCRVNTYEERFSILFLLILHCVMASISGCSMAPVEGSNLTPSKTISLPDIANELPEMKIERDLAVLKRLHAPDNSAYTIGIGDKFNIYVYNEEDLNTEGIIVKMDGTITCKLVGDVQVKGLTIPAASERMEASLKEYIRYPKVSLIPYEMKSSSFTIMGKVKQPGFYYFEGKLRLADAIARAEGLSVGIFDNNTIELADLEHSFVRRGEQVLPIDFVGLLRRGNPLMNIPLKNGDYIFIPSAMNQEVYIIGEVVKQGYFGFKPNMTVGRLFAHAEGIRESAGDDVLIIRGNIQHPKVYKVSRNKLFKGEIQDFRLQPNDIVYVPKGILGSWNSVLAQIVPTLEAGLLGFDIDNEVARRK